MSRKSSERDRGTINVTTGPSAGDHVTGRSGGQSSGCLFRPEQFRLDDPAIQADRYGSYPVLCDQEPVLRTTVGDQTWWVLSRQTDVLKALMDPGTFSSRTLPDAAVLFSAPPEHDRLRAWWRPGFPEHRSVNSQRRSRSMPRR